MASNLRVGLACLLLAPALVSATSFGYYRSVFCDAQSAGFFLERYTSLQSLADDKRCHQTPAGTRAMKLVDSLDSSCVVLAYEDYECSSLVGSVPVSGKCVAATKAKIGSWQAQCNSTDSSQVSAAVTSYAPGELKRRGKYRLPAVRDEANTTNRTTDPIATASSIVSEISSAISESATATDAEVTPSPSAGAAFSSAVSSGADIGYNLTSYLTDTAGPAATTGAGNATGTPSMTTTSAPKVVTYSGNTHANGSVTFQRGAAATNQIGNGKALTTILTSMLVILGAAVAP